MSKRLITIAIIHDDIDMGSLSEEIADAYRVWFGEAGWHHHKSAVNTIWESIEESIAVLDLDYSATRLYQDGLPVTPIADRIVDDLAEKGSRNHRLLRRLIDKGATLMGTEDPALLIEEFNRLKGALQEGRRISQLEQARGLIKRDAFIADRIAETLRDGETGLLFIGLKHDVESQLSDDIEFSRLSLVKPAGSEG